MKRFIGNIMMIIPLQFVVSEIAILRGVELGSIAWWVFVLLAGYFFYIGNSLSSGKY